MKWLWTSGTADHWLGWEQCFMWTTKFDQVDSCSSNLVLDEKIVCEKTLIYWWVWFPGFKVPFISWRETWHKKTKKIAYIALLQLNLSWNIWSVWDDCCNSRKYLMSFCFYEWTWCELACNVCSCRSEYPRFLMLTCSLSSWSSQVCNKRLYYHHLFVYEAQ